MPNSKHVSLEENPIGCNGINFLCEEMLVAKPNTGNIECEMKINTKREKFLSPSFMA